MQRLLSVYALTACLTSSLAVAQFQVVVPDGAGTAPGNSSNAFPWGTTATSWPGLRLMAVYGSVNFTNQNVNSPILINQLKWRPNDTSNAVAGGQFNLATIELSTSPTGWQGVSTNYATNHGVDRTLVYDAAVNGPVIHTATPGSAGWTVSSWCIDITLPVPFLYDPTQGDLVVDVDYPTGSFSGGGVGQMDVQGAGSNSSRIFASSMYPAANGTTQNHGPVIEVGYLPPSGLYPSFNATPTSGPVNTPVQFTDTTYTSDPGGVLAWQWDLDGDGTTDSTVQNPLFNYTTEGIYDVSLTATDAMHGTVSFTQTGYIEIDTVDASFATQFLPASTVIYTDTSTGSPTSWAWDVDGDNVTDYTTQNCAHVYPGPGAYSVTLTVTDAISTDTTTVSIGVDIIPMPPFSNTYSFATNVRGFWFQSPVKFSITSLQVPDETTFGTQNAAIYRGTSIAANGTPNGAQELEFISLLQPAANTIPCAVSFDVGDYVCVLGACGDAAIMHNSYGPGGPSSVLGQPITVARLYSQVNLNAPNPEGFTMIGSTVASPSTIARVFCGVTSCSGVPYGTGSPSGNPGVDAPKMRCTDLPFLGTTATLSVEQGDAQVLGFMGTGLGRTSVPAPFGEILINNILGIEVMNGGTLVGPGTYTYSWNVPNNAGLIGVDVNHQYVQLDIPSNTIAMSNGVELQFAQ